MDPRTQPIGPRPKGKKNRRNAPSFDLRTELYRITGIDWSQINGIDVLTAQTVIAEAGADLSAFPSEQQFARWLGLCPANEQKRRPDLEPPNSEGCQPCQHGFSTWISNGAKPGGITGFAKAFANAPGLRLRLPS
jgi:Transposase IS116/IS110/IS902 family